MVYIRRYLSGQQATTVTIAQGAITSDKIVDGAVTHPKLAPGSVDSERIIDETIKSEDIKAGEVKSVDIASGAITTDKIASQAVTIDKLEASIQGIARPLTPGVDTDEIQDAKVTLAKLAPDSVDASKIKSGAVGPTELAANAVEESRVKDGAISTSKIAGSAIDSTKIAVNAVTGSEILNGSVGVAELAANAVETVKIKDRNVTSPKIALEGVIAEHVLANADMVGKLNLASDRLLNRFFDDFMGNALHPMWVTRGEPGFSVLPSVDSCWEMKTNNVLADGVVLDWGGNLSAGPTGTVFPLLTVGLRDRVGITHLDSSIGLWNDATNYIIFLLHTVGGEVPTWKARCVKGGVSTEIDTGIPVSMGLQTLRIQVEALNNVFFFINDVQVANVTDAASIPDLDMEARLELIAGEAAQKSVKVDYVSLLQTRETP